LSQTRKTFCFSSLWEIDRTKSSAPSDDGVWTSWRKS